MPAERRARHAPPRARCGSRRRLRRDGDSRRPAAATDWPGRRGCRDRRRRGRGAASTGRMSATRSASGPMLAPRAAGADVGGRADQADESVHGASPGVGAHGSDVERELAGRRCRAGRSRTRRRAAPRPPRRSRRSGTGARSSGAIMPVSTSRSKSISRVQNSRPNSRIGRMPRLAGLHQRQHLEQLVERAEAAGEAHQRDRAHQEVHLAQREVVELEAQLAA